MIAVQASAQFVCLNDEGELYFSSGVCGQQVEEAKPGKEEVRFTLEDVERAEMQVRLADAEARIRSLEEAFEAFVRGQMQINDVIGQAFDLIEERMK